MATVRTYVELITTFVTNTVRSISGQDSGDIVESFAARLAIAAFGFPTPTTITTVAGVPEIIPLTGFVFYPDTDFSIVGGAINIASPNRYQVGYKLTCTPASAADITISLYADTGSGFVFQPLSDHVDERTAGKSGTLSDTYTINASVANTKLALYVVTAADESLTLSQAYLTLSLLPVLKLA
jgi:hypothetical protein